MDNSTDVMRTRRPLTIEGIRLPAAERPAPPIQARPMPRRPKFTPRSARPESKIWQKLQLPTLVVVCCIAGFFADNLILGLTLVVGYGIFALVTRVPSHTTFTLALLLLGTISLLLLFKPSSSLTNNFATYAFMLLIIGVVTLGRESRLHKRTRRRYYR